MPPPPGVRSSTELSLTVERLSVKLPRLNIPPEPCPLMVEDSTVRVPPVEFQIPPGAPRDETLSVTEEERRVMVPELEIPPVPALAPFPATVESCTVILPEFE